MNGNYILDATSNPIEEPDILKWAAWMEKAERRVAKDTVGDVDVSTVFLGLDHRHGSGCRPILWETMIFGGKHDGYQERYVSREYALEGHAKAVKLASAKITKKCGVDWQNPAGALTLDPEQVCDTGRDTCGDFARTHADGWTISGRVVEDYFYWVNDFSAEHPTLGRVWGNYEEEVHADSEEGFADFYAKHPPSSWDYGDI